MMKHEVRESHVKRSKHLVPITPKLAKFVGSSNASKLAEVQICAWAVEKNKSAPDV